MANTKYLTLRGYARHRGVTLRAVQKAIAAGRISAPVRGSRPMVNVQRADRQWAQRTRPSAIKGSSSDALSFSRSRSQREFYNAKLARLEYRRRSGELLEAEAVRKRIASLVGEARDALLNLPDKVGPVLVSQTNVNEVIATLRLEIQSALESLSRLSPKAN
jgi:hypothetical protein